MVNKNYLSTKMCKTVTYQMKSFTKRPTAPGETHPCNGYVLETAVEMLTALGSALVNITSWLRTFLSVTCVCAR